MATVRPVAVTADRRLRRRRRARYVPAAPAICELSAGALVRRARDDHLLLLHERRGDRWCFPKGHVDPGESLRTAAQREIAEETGITRLKIARELREVHYRFYDPGRRVNVIKTCVYFLAETVADEVRLEPIFDRFAWLPARTARRRVAFAEERAVIDALAGLRRSGR